MPSDTVEGNSHNSCISEDENNIQHGNANPHSKLKFAGFLQRREYLYLVVIMHLKKLCFD